MPYRLVYVSSAKQALSPAALQEILSTARQSNAQAGISGMLLYKDGGFIQLLEGEKTDVLRLFDRIKTDPRHGGVLILDEKTTEARVLADWSMGYCAIGPGDADGAGLFKLTQESLADRLSPEAPREILRFMENFYQINRG